MKTASGKFLTKGSAVYPRVVRAIAKLGHDISLARRTRRIAAEDFAAQMGVSRATLHRLENGDPGVSLNTLAMAMSALGRLDMVAGLADPTTDDVGLGLTLEAAPRRVRRAAPVRPREARDDGAHQPDGNGFVGW